jgi:hypothetical protein
MDAELQGGRTRCDISKSEWQGRQAGRMNRAFGK